MLTSLLELAGLLLLVLAVGMAFGVAAAVAAAGLCCLLAALAIEVASRKRPKAAR